MLFNWSPDFELCFGANGNSRTDLYVDGNLRRSMSTPGLLGSGRYEEFEISWVGGTVVVSNVNFGIMMMEPIDGFPVRFVEVRQVQ